ncbi:MAG TPA: hypothetical protein ENI65_10840 [Gammaproteobacteria bacterium]|nr:hypothetical protein [Gammaproteobacteria bacterium]
MNTKPETRILHIPSINVEIPTLDVLHDPSSNQEAVDSLVSRLSEELQSTLHQHLYQVMIKAMHQVVHKETQKLTGKVEETISAHLPEIIKAACQQTPSDK